MDIFLNDWSCDGDGPINQYRVEMQQFLELIKALHKTGLCRLIIDKSIFRYKICGFAMSGCHYPYDNSVSADYRLLLQQLDNYFVVDALDHNVKLDHPAGKGPSILVGHAHKNATATFSLSINPSYTTPFVDGLDGKHKVHVPNLYRADSMDVLSRYMFSRQECRKYNPTNNPLWNSEATEKYHASIAPELKALVNNPNQKYDVLIKHSTVIATLNGWKFDETVTKKNTNKGQIRHIFRAEHFSRAKAYLSIDFEKPEINFELHNKKGKHLGEVSWKGDIGKPEQKHDIIV